MAPRASTFIRLASCHHPALLTYSWVYISQDKPRLLLLAGSQKGTSLHFANKLAARAKVAGMAPAVVDVKDYEVRPVEGCCPWKGGNPPRA